MVKKARPRGIDIIMQGLGFRNIGDKVPKNYNYMYSAKETNIKVANITTCMYYTTYELVFFMTSDEWDFKFDKVGFELEIRNKYKSQCKFQSVNIAMQGIKRIVYTIITLEKRR